MKHKELTLKLLKNWLDSENKPNFNIDHFYSYSPYCGTVMCAIGYLGTTKEFNELGLKLITNEEEKSEILYQGLSGRSAISRFFSLSLCEVSNIFYQLGYASSQPTLQNVIDKIKLLEAT